jgi:5-oxoprolinase (ATP-hydrolysing)
MRTAKHLSHNPDAYDDAAIFGIRQFMGLMESEPLPAGAISAIKMGTTVATNALLERKGEPTLFVTSKGFGDVIEIGYQARPKTFALNIQKPRPLYSKVVEIEERVLADGSVSLPFDPAAARPALEQAYAVGFRAIAIALMHGYRFPAHEQALARLAQDIGFTQVSVSHDVSPLSKIVSRAETTVVDAYLTPILRRYVEQVEGAFDADQQPQQLLFMQSSGGLTASDRFRGRDAILSGPAGGIVGCVATAKQAGFDKVIGFDMGGTSTDVSHYSGEFEKVYETEVAGVRMRVPMLHIHTVAAGGGSILHYDGERFRVGPDSAGADPGPASYRRGGPLTVTDINVALGRLNAEFFPKIFGPNQDQGLDTATAISGFEEIAGRIADGRSAEQVAEGFLDVAVEHMAQAIKQISLSRGYDPKDYVLNCFGGAGGQHACLVAEKLGIRKILLHPMAGVLSAYGMGMASIQAERQQMFGQILGEDLVPQLQAAIAELERQTRLELTEQGVAESSVSVSVNALLRYQSTDTTLSVRYSDIEQMLSEFAAVHQRQFGFCAPEKRVVLDTLIVETQSVEHSPKPASDNANRAKAEPVSQTRIFAGGEWHDAPVFELQSLAQGQQLSGPAMVIEPTGTVIIEPNWSGELDRLGNLILSANAVRASEATTEKAVDPVQLEIFNNRYMSIAEQMGIILRNTSQSVNVKERLDFSCAIFDAEGNLVANAPHVPVHLGSMDASVKTIIASGQEINCGDAFVQNNPHSGGSHLPDITVVSPVFDDAGDTILFYVASRAHHEDVGGISPGSMSPFGRTIHDEGILLDNLKLVDRGVFQSAMIEQAFGAGPYPARNIAQNVADLMAQVAANAAGAKELLALTQAYGLDVVQSYMGHIQDNAEEAVRKVVADLEEGICTLELDSGARIAVAITVNRTERNVTVDFTGTSAQLNSAFNAPAAVTRAAVLYVLRCLIDDDIPLNAGCMKPVELILPEGSMLNPAFPAAVVAGNVETSQAVTDALFAALGRLGSSQGTMNNLTFGNARYQYYETICSGAPAGPGFDGASAVHTHMTNTRMTDPEILEQRFPVTLKAFRIDRGSGGKGRWNAGDGVTREIVFQEEMDLSVLSEHRRVAPLGSEGGSAGRVGRNSVERADGSIEDIGGCGHAQMTIGDRIVICTPTGGGFGPLEEREAEQGSSGQ